MDFMFDAKVGQIQELISKKVVRLQNVDPVG